MARERSSSSVGTRTIASASRLPCTKRSNRRQSALASSPSVFTRLFCSSNFCGQTTWQLSALGIVCHVVCPQKLDEQNKRVKTDGLDDKALCLKLDRFVQGNRDALAIVRVPTEEEERSRAIHRQREQLVARASDWKLRGAVSWSIT